MGVDGDVETGKGAVRWGREGKGLLGGRKEEGGGGEQKRGEKEREEGRGKREEGRGKREEGGRVWYLQATHEALSIWVVGIW